MDKHHDGVAARRRQTGGARQRLNLLILGAACVAMISATQADATTNQVRISGLSDVAFGTITNFASDDVSSQSVCVYSKSPPQNHYSVTANGSGSGGTFVLSSATGTLAYEVQWNATANETVGTQLLANQALTGQQAVAGGPSADDCSKGPPTTASLIVILRSAAIIAASSGDYTGTLTLLVAPE